MPVLRAPTGMETKESAVAPIATTRPSTRLLPYGEIHYPPAGRGQAVLCTQISGDEVSRLFPGLYQYVWRIGRPEAEIRGGLVADGVVGLVIGTRPDCMPDSLLDYLEEMNRHTFLLVEYGIESTDDKTLAASTAGILPCRRRCGGKNRFTRNPDRWACHPRTAGRDARKYRSTSRCIVPPATHYLEDAPVATDKGYPHGSGVPAVS